jgi:hypothetical protein
MFVVEKLAVSQLLKNNTHFMKTEYLLLCSQQPSLQYMLNQINPFYIFFPIHSMGHINILLSFRLN